MLQRLLSEFLNVEGVEQATAIDDRGRLLSSVATEGQLPLTQRAVDVTVASLDVAQGSDLGDLQEVWIEGQTTTCIDIVTPYRILMLSGGMSNIARWRHSIDRLRRQLATTHEL